MSSPGFRMAHATDTALIDFHTNELGRLNFDSRIKATGGTMDENGGTLSLSSGTMNYTAGSGHNFNGGINCGDAVRLLDLIMDFHLIRDTLQVKHFYRWRSSN